MAYTFCKSTKPNRTGIQSPYNPAFVDELKKVASNPAWNNSTKTWYFDDISKPDVEALAAKYFDESNKVRRTVTFALKNAARVEADGSAILWIARDSWRRANCIYPFRIIESELATGGSRNNPNLSGKLTIEIECNRETIFTPTPEDVR